MEQHVKSIEAYNLAHIFKHETKVILEGVLLEAKAGLSMVPL